MSARDRRHSAVPAGRRLRRSTTGLVALVLLLAGVTFWFDLGTRWFGWEYPSPVTEPAQVAPPPGLTLPEPRAAAAVAKTEDTAQRADPAKVRRALARLLRDEDLGRRVAVAVHQLDGTEVFRTGPNVVTPASTMKLLTSTAALATLGPDHTFGTTAVVGSSPREVVLVGGGDPLLARTPVGGDEYPPRGDIATLAKATAKSLRELGRDRVRLGYDASLFTGPAESPDWPASYVPDSVVSPISALWVDEGRVSGGATDRVEDPPLAAAQAFARVLEKQGITVRGRPRTAVAPARPDVLARVESATLAQIVQWLLETSDNEATEVLFRHVALARGRPASFAGGGAAVRGVLSGLGVDTAGERILDGSGLSRLDRVSPETLLAVLRVAAGDRHPELRPVVANLPVAGWNGSLVDRFVSGDPAGLGRVRAKTGTLSGVHGLAGIVTDRDGTVLSFVAVADRVRLLDTLDARQTLDEMAAALAGCRCSA